MPTEDGDLYAVWRQYTLGISDPAAPIAVPAEITPVKSGVITAKVSAEDVAKYSNDAYPTTDLMFTDDKGNNQGYVFAGWYQDAAGTVPYTSMPTGEAYAKFVNADLLRIRWQVPSTATLEDESMGIRTIGTVDCLDYRSFGMKLTMNGKTYSSMTETVYTYIKATAMSGSVLTIYPSQMTQNSEYIYTVVWSGIKKKNYGVDIDITAYWTTADGTLVEGTPRTIQIQNHSKFRN